MNSWKGTRVSCNWVVDMLQFLLAPICELKFAGNGMTSATELLPVIYFLHPNYALDELDCLLRGECILFKGIER